MSSRKVGIVLLIIKFYTYYNGETGEYTDVFYEEDLEHEDYENVVSVPWSIEAWAFCTNPLKNKNKIKAFCYVDMNHVETEDFEKIKALAEIEMKRKVSAYVSEQTGIYADACRRTEGL